jgi:Xaa-Pro aminopeptidase
MNAKFVFSIILLLLLTQVGRSQNDPRDLLGSAFRVSRRGALRQNMPPKSCAVFFSGGFQSQTEGAVEPRPFVPDPNFLYFTGLKIPDAVLVVFQAPMALSEGSVDALLFLPDQKDDILKAMGEEWQGKFGLVGEGLAIRPATQWRRFCIEVLSADETQSIYSFPYTSSDYRKRGELSYTDLGSIFYTQLAPGFPFDPSAQHFYREIIRSDSAALKVLSQRVTAYLNYFPDVRRDPILEAFSRATAPGDLSRIQAQIKSIKIDLIGLVEKVMLMRLVKTREEQALLERACKIAAESADFAANGKPARRLEQQLQASAEYAARYKGATLPLAVRVAAGPNTAAPYYNQNADSIPAKGLVVLDIAPNWGGYFGRITRTLPAQGRFEGKDAELYSALRGVHMSALSACKPGSRPSALLNDAQASFDDVLKRLDIAPAGNKGVVRVFDISPIGLDLNEFAAPAQLQPGMAFCVETAIYIQSDQGVKADWRNKGVVLRDVVLITEGGSKVLTGSFTTDLGGIEALLNRSGRQPLD